MINLLGKVVSFEAVVVVGVVVLVEFDDIIEVVGNWTVAFCWALTSSANNSEEDNKGNIIVVL
jgi:hypothetical protein